jgi:hypothetical protein
VYLDDVGGTAGVVEESAEEEALLTGVEPCFMTSIPTANPMKPMTTALNNWVVPDGEPS